MNEPSDAPARSSAQALANRIERQARRRERAGATQVGNLWQQVARVGTLGWMIVLPIVGGAVLGHLIDRRFDTGIRWALAMMSVGVVAGGFALWRAMQEGVGD